MMNVILRPATVADAEAIAEVRIKSWRATYRGMIPDSYLDDMKLDESAAHWAKILEVASDRVCVFVAESENGIVGFASGMLLPEEKLGLDAELTAVYLSPDMQRSGIGRRMVQDVAQALKAKGAKGLLVWVISGNKPARKFYEHLGAELLIEQGFNWDGMDLQEVGYGWKSVAMLLPGTAALRRNLH
ncbi:GNAT family N-acetyltransferase [Undibacterium terreum]|uniref:N-acetyltransferase n=1 Tax=Undibacterium terreum TaxID=1224302 RepID=A0A916UGZ8_9BURK|nr:GNAT family N-acetyltransferase [Undibacterium terreum]GGC72555.1 N-acetyltransferase [Undibacterium terreum]